MHSNPPGVYRKQPSTTWTMFEKKRARGDAASEPFHAAPSHERNLYSRLDSCVAIAKDFIASHQSDELSP